MKQAAAAIPAFQKKALLLKKEIADLESTLRFKWSALRFAQGRIKFCESYLEEQHKVSVANKLERFYKIATG